MPIEIYHINGIKVAHIQTESNLGLFGIFNMAGSNFESPANAGVAHFGEHMFFKGTTSKNWKELSRLFAVSGIIQNAYTDNDEIFYHASFPVEQLEITVKTMCDMFFNSTVPTEEMEKERQVILEEKNEYDDDPESAFGSHIGKTLFDWNVGHDIIGTNNSIRAIKREDIVAYQQSKLNYNNILIICVGNIDKTRLEEVVCCSIPASHLFLSDGEQNKIETSSFFKEGVMNVSDPIKTRFYRKNIEQSHVQAFVKGISMLDKNSAEYVVLTAALGGGMYSMLFEKIREELGLCYSVCSFISTLKYPDVSHIRIAGQLDPKNIDKFMLATEDIIRDVRKNGLPLEIFQCAKNMAVARLLQMTETSSGRAEAMVKRIFFGQTDDIQATIRSWKNATLDGCNDLFCRLFDPDKLAWAVMLPKE